jgi:DNA-binding NarL/FixJ family response regulator
MQPHGISVMLVDDHAVVREGYRRLIEKHKGMKVVAEAPDGAEAYRLYKQLRPDVVVLDVMLPGRSGHDILADLRGDPDLAALPVLVLTARGLRDMPEGATRVMAKPFVNADMVSAVRAIARGNGAAG